MAYQLSTDRPAMPSMPDWQEILELASKATKDAHAAYVDARDEYDDADAALTIPPLSAANNRRQAERRQAMSAGRLMASVATGDLSPNDDLDQAEERRRVALRAANRAAKAYDATARADDRLVSKLDTLRRESKEAAARLRAVADAEALHSVQLAEALIRLRHKREDLFPIILDQINYEEGDTFGGPRDLPAPSPTLSITHSSLGNLTPNLAAERGPRVSDVEEE